MTFTVYILYSAEKDRFYIGQTNYLNERLQEHNIRKNLGASDWALKYSEVFNTRSEAMQREAEIKPKKRRAYFVNLINKA